MALTYTQTDNAADCGAMSACSGGTLATQTGTSECISGGTAGSTEQTIEVPSNSTAVAFFTQTSGGVGQTTWNAGTYTVGLNVTTAQSDLSIQDIYICRIDSACTSLETVGSASVNQTLNTGTYTFDVSGTEQSASSADDLYVIYEFSNAHQHSSRTAGITPSENIATPITVTVSESTSLGTTVSTSTSEQSLVTLSGTCTLDGSTVSGATVVVFNDTQGSVAGQTTSDSNGNWSMTVTQGDVYHAFSQYDDGSTQYNEHSQPFLAT